LTLLAEVIILSFGLMIAGCVSETPVAVAPSDTKFTSSTYPAFPLVVEYPMI